MPALLSPKAVVGRLSNKEKIKNVMFHDPPVTAFEFVATYTRI